MRLAEALVTIKDVAADRVVGGDVRAEQGSADDGHDDDGAEHGEAVAEEAAQRALGAGLDQKWTELATKSRGAGGSELCDNGYVMSASHPLHDDGPTVRLSHAAHALALARLPMRGSTSG